MIVEHIELLLAIFGFGEGRMYGGGGGWYTQRPYAWSAREGTVCTKGGGGRERVSE